MVEKEKEELRMNLGAWKDGNDLDKDREVKRWTNLRGKDNKFPFRGGKELETERLYINWGMTEQVVVL